MSQNPTPPSDIAGAIERLTRLAKDHGPTLSPYKDHNGFDQHDRMRADLRLLLGDVGKLLEDGFARDDQFSALPALIMQNIEAFSGWANSTALITARAHAYVLHHDLPKSLDAAKRFYKDFDPAPQPSWEDICPKCGASECWMSGCPKARPSGGALPEQLCGPYFPDEIGTFNAQGWGFGIRIPDEWWGVDTDDVPEEIKQLADTPERTISQALAAHQPPSREGGES